MSSTRAGFTLVEVLIAVVILTTGLLAIAAGSGSVFRMLDSGRRSAVAAAMATSRIEALRRDAYRTSPRCTALVGGSASNGNGVSEQWTVTGSGRSRTVQEIVFMTTPHGVSRDTVFANLECL